MSMFNRLAAVSLALFAGHAMAQQSPPAQALTAPDAPSQAATAAALEPAAFARQASAGNAFEIRSSELALTRTQSEAVKDFAQTMIDHHTRAQTELQDAAKSDGVRLSEEPSKEQTQMLMALEQADESQFDSTYLSAQMKAHDQAIQLLGAYADSGSAGGLKTYAAAHYPTVRTHMVQAQGLTSQ